MRDPLLNERQQTHGSFARNAEISQAIKSIYRRFGYHDLRDEHVEALEMIALKLSRVLSGQASQNDHWDDIAGYAKLAVEANSRTQSWANAARQEAIEGCPA